MIGSLPWTNAARSFDAVRASYRGKGYRIDAFVSSVVNARDGAFDRRTDGNNLDHQWCVLWTFANGKIVEGRHLAADQYAVDAFFNQVAATM